MLVGPVALLVSFHDSLCLASSSSRPKERAEDQSAAKAEIPFQLYNDNLIIVKATIGTVKNVNMILDTGTSPSAISRELADRLRLRGKTESLQTLNGAIQTQSLILPSIQIGPLAASPIRVVVQDLSFMERGLGISLGGIAGLDILSSDSFTIDYRRRKIVFGPIAASEKTVRFETQEPFLTVKAMIEGHEVRLLVDSGIWGLLVYRNRRQIIQQQVHFDSSVSISSPGGTKRLPLQHRHDAVGEQQKTLNAKLRGHYQYYGRPSNDRAIRLKHGFNPYLKALLRLRHRLPVYPRG
jgi:Aspartyl protease